MRPRSQTLNSDYPSFIPSFKKKEMKPFDLYYHHGKKQWTLDETGYMAKNMKLLFI